MSNSEEEDSDYSDNSSESEGVETPKRRGLGTQMKNNDIDDNKKNLSEYEKQRMKTIEDNRARMEALGLKTMAKSLMGSASKGKKISSEKKGKRNLGRYDDEEYKPAEDDDDDDKDDSGDEEFTVSRKDKGKKTIKAPRKPSTKRRVPKRKLDGYPDYVDDDDALMQAIAMSLQDSAGFLNVKNQASQNSAPQVIGNSSSNVVNKGNTQIQEDAGKRKKKKPVTNRVQMTEDEVILHFFQFDEAGKGEISLRDVQRLAAAHDFMWSDKEMADMIRCFDIDGDGKLSLDDFRKIVRRCNLIQAPEKAVIG